MKILFVCEGNTGRSQVAEALFNELSRHRAHSAGTRVESDFTDGKPNSETVKDARGGQVVVEYMKREGIDVSDNRRNPLTSQLVEDADKVVVITAKDTWPEYLKRSEKVVFWDLPNPVDLSSEDARSVYDRVKKNILDLVDEIG